MKEYLYSEIFYSIQGEGKYTGIPTAWLRYFNCNLQCNGFGQKEPTKPETYVLPYQTIDISNIKVMEELPVFQYGCDSSYSWSKKFKHLQRSGSPEKIASLIIDTIKNDHNPDGLFTHPQTGLEQHMCFTGGEPLLPKSQECTVELFKYWDEVKNSPLWITFETNGTKEITYELEKLILTRLREKTTKEFFFSISPKLFNTSGEPSRKAIHPEIIAQYDSISNGKGQLKFVVNGRQETWDELDDVLHKLRQAGIRFPVYVMPVGATAEGQAGMLEGHMDAGKIAEQALKRGFNVSSRVHVNLWGNLIGV